MKQMRPWENVKFTSSFSRESDARASGLSSFTPATWLDESVLVRAAVRVQRAPDLARLSDRCISSEIWEAKIKWFE